MTKFQQMRLNRIRLDACPAHCFEVEGVEVVAGEKVRCRNCKGEMSLVQANEYVRGFEAAGGDPFQVWATWNEPGAPAITRCPCCVGFRDELKKVHCVLCDRDGFVTVEVARSYLKEHDEC